MAYPLQATGTAAPMDRERVVAFSQGRAPQYAAEEDPALIRYVDQLLAEAERWHRGMAGWRAEYREARDLARGYHWDRWMTDEAGRSVREGDYLRSKGRKPLIVNLVGAQLNQLVGQFRQNESERDVFPVDAGDAGAAEMLSTARRSIRRQNASNELEADQFYSHALGGLVAFRSIIERGGPALQPGVHDFAVHPTRLFYNRDVADRRMTGLRIVGELHDLAPAQIASRLCRSAEEVERVLGYYDLRPSALDTGPYGGAVKYGGHGDNRGHRFGFGHFDADAFRTPSAPGTHRVIEVWVCEYEWQVRAVDPLAYDPESQALPDGHPLAPTLREGDGPLPPHLRDPATLQMEQGARQMMGLPPLEVHPPDLLPVWRYYYCTPRGQVIRYGTSGYWHGEHPFTVGAALMLDGETWGVVQNIHDPQRWMNAALAHLDHAIRTNPRGTTFVDQRALDDAKLTLAQFNDAMTRGDATVALAKNGVPWDEVIKHLQPGQLPPGFFELVNLMPQLMERVSGITEAAQGIHKTNTTATQYERSVAQSSVATFIYQDSFFECLNRKDRKEVRLIQQSGDRPTAYYDLKRGAAVEYDPARARALRFDVAMGAAAETPTLKLAREGMLREDVAAGLLPYEVYLAHSGRPDAATLLQDFQAYQQQQLLMQAQAAMLADQLAPPPEEDDK